MISRCSTDASSWFDASSTLRLILLTQSPSIGSDTTYRLWQLRLFLFLRTYHSRVWDPLFYELSLSVLYEVPVAPEVRAAAIALPAGVFELDTHSSSEADPSKSSPPPVSVAPMVSPFMGSGDSESDTKIPKRHVSPTPHEAMFTRWRSRVALRSSSPSTSILEIPTTPILPAPSAIVAPSSEYQFALVVSPPRIHQ
ncbi:hypothetical protein Tco_0580139 [Tanacetum coccineum]